MRQQSRDGERMVGQVICWEVNSITTGSREQSTNKGSRKVTKEKMKGMLLVKNKDYAYA